MTSTSFITARDSGIPGTRRGHERRRVFVFALAALVMCGVFARPAAAHDEVLQTLVSRAKHKRLAQSRMWQVLLHYRTPPFGRAVRSEADGMGFFFAGKRGKLDAEAELEATLAAFRRPPAPVDAAHYEESQPAACRFPARFAWLKDVLGWSTDEIPDRPCPVFETWRQGFAAERVTLVFSSAYMNSPASMYGHTFLRLYRRTGEGNPLLDYIINFAADKDTDNGLVYGVKGLFGGFRGRFYVMPYYMKIQEYSHIESRDLWEYELSLTSEQAERMVQHAFETRSTHFDYYFLSENCSYQLLALLEVADPSLHLTDRFGGWVIPGDTVRAVLAQPGLVRSIRGRPSLRAELLARKSAMTEREIAATESLAASGRSASSRIDGMPPERQAFTLDAAGDLLRYREGLVAQPSESYKQRERDLFIMRGKTGIGPLPSEAVPATSAPETGHGTFRTSLAVGVAGRDHGAIEGFEDLSLRFALHDLLDRPDGYSEDAVLEMMSLRLRFENERQRVLPERVDALQIVSATPMDRWTPKTSWQVWFGGGQDRARLCADRGALACAFVGLRTGGGVSVRPGRWALLFASLDNEIDAGPAFSPAYRFGLGGSATGVVRAGRLFQIEARARYIHYLLGDTDRHPTFALGQAWNFGRVAQLRLVGERWGAYMEGRAEAVGYF